MNYIFLGFYNFDLEYKSQNFLKTLFLQQKSMLPSMVNFHWILKVFMLLRTELLAYEWSKASRQKQWVVLKKR